MADDRRVLVTGGAGFIGSHLVRALLDRGDRVVVIDDLSTGRRENLDEVPEDRLEFVEGSVGACLDQISAVDEIYHLAAAVGVRLVVDSPIACIETNVHETAHVLRRAADDATPILLASTSEVYGKSEQVPFVETADVCYGPTTEPRWAYACSKAIDEHLGLSWHQSTGLPVTIARFFNTVGPRQRGRWGMVLPRFVAAALAGDELCVHGDGLQQRCFVDVRDVAPMLPALLGCDGSHGQVINVGHDVPITIQDLAVRVIDVLGSQSEIVYRDIAEDYGRPIEDLRCRIPDLSRLRGLITWDPKLDLDETILATAAHLRQGAL